MVAGGEGEVTLTGEAMIYRCLSCGRTVERDEPDDDLPRSDEHCSHEWERVVENDQRAEDEANYNRMIGESLRRYQ